jgi:VIT1/CCC1 family predicted Fe2+/Mn2+ transporter
VDPDGPRAGLSGRLNRLRAGVLGATDGIVSTAGLVVGVAGATTTGAVLTAGIAGLVAGAVSMALGEYVSVSSQRDTEKSLLDREGAELEQFPPRSSPSSPGCTELRASAPRPRSGWPRN